jgi:MFS family permease
VRNFRLLARRNFGLLWAGGFISFIGDWVLYIGMPISIYRITGSTLATTLMFVAGVVPSVVLGSVTGVYVDRWDRRRTVIIGNVLLAAALLPLTLVRDADTIWIVYVVVLLEASVGQFVNPAVGALLPRLVIAGLAMRLRPRQGAGRRGWLKSSHGCGVVPDRALP